MPWRRNSLSEYSYLNSDVPLNSACLNFVNTCEVSIKTSHIWKPEGDLDHFQNLMGSKLDQEPSSAFCHEVPTSGIVSSC